MWKSKIATLRLSVNEVIILYGNKTGSLCEWRNADMVLLARATVHRNSASTSDGGT